MGALTSLGVSSSFTASNSTTITLTVSDMSNYRYLQFNAYFVNSSNVYIGPHNYFSNIISSNLFRTVYKSTAISFYDMVDNVGFLIRINYASNTSCTFIRYRNANGNTNWDSISMRLQLYGIK